MCNTMFTHRGLILFVIFLSLKYTLCANILYVAPLASPSHHIWNKALAMALIEKGHNITMLCHETEPEPIPNLNIITMEGMYEALAEHFATDGYMEPIENPLLLTVGMYEFVKFCCEFDLETNGLQTLLSYPQDYKFDLIIIDVTINQCFFPLIDRFHNPSVVAVTPFLLPPVFSHSFGNHLYTSYMPHYNSIFGSKMNILERTLNFVYTYTEIFIRNYMSTPVEFELSKRRFGENIRPLPELERNISLLLANIDPILVSPVALPPNIIPVGGLQIKPAKALPEDLKKVLDNSKHGVILFSLGTNIKSDQLKPQEKKALLDAFAKFPQTILWKFESDEIDGRPENLIIRKWLPQNDILGHPNTKLFISHGGALSTQEAMYHGVPVVGIPFFADQHLNIAAMEEKKIGKRLDKNKLTNENVYQTIKEVLDSHIYKDNIRIISKLYRDQPQTALERGVFWIEYVLRHGTAEHLVLPARDMPFYQTSNLDVLAVLLLGLVLVYSVIVFAFTGCRYLVKMREFTKVKAGK